MLNTIQQKGNPDNVFAQGDIDAKNARDQYAVFRLMFGQKRR
jgi:hypothetical protein